MNPRSIGGVTAALALAALAAFASTAAAQTAAPSPAAPPSVAPPKAEARANPSPESIKEGKALFAKFVAGFGGKQKVSTVRDVQTRGQVTAKTAQGEMNMDVQTSMVFPDKISQQVDAPFGRLAMVATPSGAFIAGPAGAQDLPVEMKDELIKQIRRVPLLLAQKADDPKLSAVAAGTEKVGTVDAKILDVSYEGAAVRWYLDPANGRVLRSAHTSLGPQGEAKIVSDYSDYRIVDGFPIAFHLEVTTNGEKDQTLVLEEIKINPGIDPKLFEKPVIPTPVPTPAPAP